VFRHVYGAFGRPRELAGTVTGSPPTAHHNAYSLILEGFMHDEATMDILVYREQGHFQPAQATCKRFNKAYPFTEISRFELDGNRLQGDLFVTIQCDGHVPVNRRAMGVRLNIDTRITENGISGTYHGRTHVARERYGRMTGYEDTAALAAQAAAPWDPARAEYPGWRGRDSNGSAPDSGHELVDNMNKVRQLWRSEQDVPFKCVLGSKRWSNLGYGGYGGPIVHRGGIFLYTYRPHGDTPSSRADDIFMRIDPRTGRTLWVTSFRNTALNHPNHKAGGHFVPCAWDGKVYQIGPGGAALCVDAETGEPLWQNGTGRAYELAREYPAASRYGGTGKGYFRSPTVAGGVLVGDNNHGGYVGLDARTGRRLWSSGHHGKYTSPIRWRYGEREFVIADTHCLDPRTGRRIWSAPDGHNGNTPAVAQWEGEHYLVCNGSKGWGLNAFKITPEGAEKIWQLVQPHGSFVTCSVCVHKGKVYTIRNRTFLMCADLKTGEILAEANVKRYNYSSPVAMDDRVFIEGLIMAAYNGERVRRMGKLGGISYQGCHTPIVADGRLILRGDDAIYCYDLRRHDTPPPDSMDVGWSRKEPEPEEEEEPAQPDPPPLDDSLDIETPGDADVQETRITNELARFKARWQRAEDIIVLPPSGETHPLDPDIREAFAVLNAMPATVPAPVPEQLARRLQSPFLNDRDLALDAILNLPAEQQRALAPRLAALAATGPYPTLTAALAALEGMRSTASDVAPSLRETLAAAVRDGRDEVVRRIQNALQALQTAAAPTMTTMAGLLQDPDPTLKRKACKALGEAGAAAALLMPELIAAAAEPDPRVAEAAVDAISRIGAAPEAVPLLAGYVQSARGGLMRASCRALQQCGPLAQDAVPALKAVLRRQNLGTFETLDAARALVAVAGNESVPELLLLASSGDRYASRFGLDTIKRMGADAVPGLSALATQPGNPLALRAVAMLGTLGSEARAAVPALIELLEHRGLAAEAAVSLLLITGNAEPPAVDALVRLSREEGLPMGTRLMNALGRLFGHPLPANLKPGLARTLVGVLRHVDPKHLGAAARMASSLGPDARELLPELRRLMEQHEGDPVASAAVEAITAIQGRLAAEQR
jgi:outer membrane protein assembly factor BamB